MQQIRRIPGSRVELALLLSVRLVDDDTPWTNAALEHWDQGPVQVVEDRNEIVDAIAQIDLGSLQVKAPGCKIATPCRSPACGKAECHGREVDCKGLDAPTRQPNGMAATAASDVQASKALRFRRGEGKIGPGFGEEWVWLLKSPCLSSVLGVPVRPRCHSTSRGVARADAGQRQATR